jgi:ribosome-associated heat shock protein Hsp15
MVEEARLEDVGSGLAPVSPGWFVVNVGEAAWVRNDAFGGRCVFESSPRVLAERPDAEPQMFADTGFTLAVLEPGKPTGMFHAESAQEDFLVLAGHVKVGGERVKPARELVVGDTIEIRLAPVRRVVVVTDLADRRGPAKVAATLYEETPESREERERLAVERRLARPLGADLGARPTKVERRRLDALRRGQRRR